jgi:hypothetical protein
MRKISMGLKAAMFGGLVLVGAHAGVAQAAPAPGPDNLVNVVVGGVTVLDSVPAFQAAQAVSEMCAVPGPAASAMVAQVDAAGGGQTACTGRAGGDVQLVQNLPPADEASPVVPGTSAQFGSGSSADVPAGGAESLPDTLPDEPDNMSGLN